MLCLRSPQMLLGGSIRVGQPLCTTMIRVCTSLWCGARMNLWSSRCQICLDVTSDHSVNDSTELVLPRQTDLLGSPSPAAGVTCLRTPKWNWRLAAVFDIPRLGNCCTQLLLLVRNSILQARHFSMTPVKTMFGGWKKGRICRSDKYSRQCLDRLP